MWISIDDAIKMYAHFCHSRYGAFACEKVKARARQLEEMGDLEGHRIWNQVAHELDGIPASTKTR
jgi:hypothetical protein